MTYLIIFYSAFQIQDSSFGGGSSSDEEDHVHSGRHHLYIQQQNSLINLLLYIGLCIISLGLIISFVGTGEKGFKTNELRLIGPCLLLVGSIFCGLRVLFCFCRVNSKFCMKKSNHHHQQFIKAHQSKQAKIISNQIQPNKESSQHHVGLIDDKAGSNLEFYKFLPFHNRTNEFVSEPMTKSSDFDGRKRVSIIPPSKSQSSELNKTLMFNPNQLIPYPVPAPVPVRLPKTVPIPSPSSGNDKKQEESTNLIDLNYSASMHDLLSLSSIEEDMEGNADNIDRISINSVTMKQLKSTIITLDNNDSSGIEYSNVINNSFEDLNYNEHNLPLTGVDLNRIESNDFSVINSDIIHNSSCDKKCDNDRYEKKNDIVLNQLTNHDRSLSSPFKNDYTVNNLSEDTIAHNISDDSKIENLKKSEQGRQNDSRDDCKNTKTNLTSQSNENNAESIEKSKSNESITKKPIRETITLNAKQNEIHRNTNFIDNSSSKIQDNRESKLTYSKDTKLNSLVDKVSKSNNVNNNIKTNSIMKDSKTNQNKGTKLNLLDSKDLKTVLNRNNMKNAKSTIVNKKVNFSTTPNSKNSIELIETHKKYNKSDCISLNDNTDSIISSNNLQTNEDELVLSPLNLKSSSKS